MSSLIFNQTNTFMGLGYTDVTIFYIFLTIALVLFVCSTFNTENWGKFILSLGAFVVMVGALLLSASIVTYTVQPQFSENTTYYDTALIEHKSDHNNTVQHIYNQSAIDVVPMNSLSVSVISLLLSLLMFGNFVWRLTEIINVPKMEVEL